MSNASQILIKFDSFEANRSLEKKNCARKLLKGAEEMNPNRWKMYTYAVQRCQNEKKTLLFVLMESKGEEDIWRSCLQFSLSTRKKGGQKLRHSFLSRFSTPFPVSSKLWKNVIAHRAPHSKTVNQNWCMKSKKS